MKAVQVTYTTTEAYAPQNKLNIERVMADLRQAAYPGIFYHACQHENGPTFIHTAFFGDAEDEKILFALSSFQQFQEALKASKPEVPPKQTLLTFIGSTKTLF